MNKTQAELLISNFIIDNNGDNSIKEAWALIRTQKSNKPKMPDKPKCQNNDFVDSYRTLIPARES